MRLQIFISMIFSVLIFSPKAETNSLTFEYSFEDHAFDSGSAKSHGLGFEIRRSLSKQLSAWARGKMVGTSYDTNSARQKTGYSLADVHLGSKWNNVYDLVTLVYGVTGSISPGMARNPRYGEVSKINSFSGHHTLAPFVGFDSISGPITFGMDAEVRLHSDIRYEDRGEAVTETNLNHFIPKIRGFAQIPVVNAVDFGLQGAISRNNFSLDQLLLGSPGNQYESEIYALAKVDRFTQISLSLAAKSLRYPLVEDSTNINIGLRLEQ